MARTKHPRRPRIYFSFRSPYSWLAWHDLTTYHPGVAAALEWRPFWEPDERSEKLLTDAGGRFVYTPMSREKHLYMLGDVRRLCQRRGLAMAWPVDRAPRWELSHLAYFHAVDHGLGAEFIERVYRARWQEGRDISDPGTVADLAAEIGMAREPVADVADDESARRRGVATLLDIDRDSVFGVPFFINRTQKYWGIDRLDDFLHSLAETSVMAGETDGGHARAKPVLPVPAVDAHSSDQGHAGGCG
jgi:2-hydroxychromene-2-carboxylate isomerase